MNAATDRLPRLLALLPYLLAHPGVRVDEAAADFGVSTRQLRRDLELLWMCGLPGYGPGDLIDLSFDGDTVSVIHDAGMRRPLRLTAAEATSLLVALRALTATPGVADTDAVRRSLAKIETAVGDAAPGVVVGSGRDAPTDPSIRATVRDAVRRRRALSIRYYTASRDKVGSRTIDPMRLLVVDGRTYLEAWCRNAEGVRLFRLDRMDAAHELPEPATPPPHAEPTDTSAGLFPSRPHQPSAVLVAEPDARWVAEYYPVEEVTELAGGRLRLRMRYADESWMVRLLLGLGDQVRVEHPARLGRLVHDRAVTAMRRARALSEATAD